MSQTPEILDVSTALDVLKEYPTHDGLTIEQLMDVETRGALTYNDFLLLPGHVGTL